MKNKKKIVKKSEKKKKAISNKKVNKTKKSAAKTAPKGKKKIVVKAKKQIKVLASYSKKSITKPNKKQLAKKLSPWLEKMSSLLLKKREELSGDINHLKDDNLKQSQKDFSGDLSGYSLHLADAGSDDFERSTALGLVSQEQDALYAIDEALEKIEEGVFGICEQCEKKISQQRLEAVPYAKLCIECKSNEERSRR